MKKLLVSIVAFLAISCNGGIHETITHTKKNKL